MPKIDRELLIERCKREMGAAREFRLPLELDLLSTVAIVGNLQLALRHPRNTGATAEIARETVDKILGRMVNDGLTAHAELVRMGDDPDYDDDWYEPKEAVQ